MKQRVLAFILTSLAVGSVSPAQTLQYSIHLEDYGWTPSTIAVTDIEADLSTTQHVAIDSAGNAYVGFSTQGTAKLSLPAESNNIFHVIEFASNSGTVAQKVEVATRSKTRVGVNISLSDGLLVTANDKIQLIDKTGSTKAAFDIPIRPSDYRHIIRIQQSASGKTLLLTVALGSYYYLNSDTLSPIAYCNIPSNQPRNEPGTFSDSSQMKIYQEEYRPGAINLPLHLVTGPFCGEPKNLWEVDGSIDRAYLMDNRTVLETATLINDFRTSALEVRNINGELVWNEILPIHFHINTFPTPVSFSRDGSRFAVEVTELRGGSERFDISARTVSKAVWIYDAKTGRRIGSINVPKQGLSELVMSPSGDKLVTLSHDGGTLKVWKL